IACMLAMLATGIYKSYTSAGHPIAVIAPPALPRAAEAAGLWILCRSFASGCTAMTGVEAVSNGVGAFRQPAVKNAHRTLTGIVFLAVMAALLLIAFRGITDRLIPLFAVGAFLAFTLSQAGMVAHWRRAMRKRTDPRDRFRLGINAAGSLATGAALLIILAAK